MKKTFCDRCGTQILEGNQDHYRVIKELLDFGPNAGKTVTFTITVKPEIVRSNGSVEYSDMCSGCVVSLLVGELDAMRTDLYGGTA